MNCNTGRRAPVSRENELTKNNLEKIYGIFCTNSRAELSCTFTADNGGLKGIVEA